MQHDLFSPHIAENNSESQAHLNRNSKHFSGQCKKLFDFLMSGGRCNGDQARELFGIRHLPRRRADLSDNQVAISDYWEDNMKVLFMTERDMEHNKNLFAAISK